VNLLPFVKILRKFLTYCELQIFTLLLDWSRLPAELNDTVKRKRKRPAKNAPPFKKAALPTVTSQLDVSLTLLT